MKKFGLFFALLALSASAHAAAPESAYDRVIRTGTIRCGYTPWPPYFNLDPNTKALTGVSKEISDAAARLLGLKLDYVDVPAGANVESFKTGKIDAMCGDGPWILASLKYVDYSKPAFYVPVFIYTRADEKRFHAPGDLNRPGVTFVAIDGDISTDLAVNNFAKARLSSMGNVTDPSQMLLSVTTHKADAVVTDPVTVDAFNVHNPGKLKKLFAAPIAVYGGGFSVRKGDADLLNTLNGAVDAVMNTGQLEPILKKYDPAGVFFLPPSRPYGSPP